MQGSTFWGILLVVIGGTVLLRNVFDINLPLWDVISPALLILWGVSMLVKNVSRSGKKPL
jgi:small neutral amino acid transporter SnatA (MarC family)